jgi:hypothetical protein
MTTRPRCTHNGLLLAPPAWPDIVAFDLGQNASVASFRCAHGRAVRTNLPVCRVLGMRGLMAQEQISRGLVNYRILFGSLQMLATALGRLLTCG